MLTHVTLKEAAKVELVEEEIITLAGCDLGFIAPGKPPQVLQVEQGSELAAHNVRTDDVLVGVDGRDTRGISKAELETLLRAASRLSFERQKSDGDVEMPPAGGVAAAVPEPPSAAADAAAQGPAVGAEAPSREAPPPPAAGVPMPAPAAVAAAETAAAAAAAVAAPAAQPAPAAPGAAHQLRTGMQVRLIGFQSAAMNGTRGRLGKFSEKQGSWQVFLEKSSAAKAVRPQNLEPLPPEECSDDLVMRDRGGDVAGGGAANGVSATAASTAAAVTALAQAAAPVVAALAAMRGVVPRPAIPPFDGPGPPPGPEWQEDALPADEDKESWVEMMRDCYVRQLRADAEYPEPPPFHRANHFGAHPLPNQPLPEGKYPAQALSFQLQMLLRSRTGEMPAVGAAMQYYYYGQGGGYWANRGREKGGKGFGGGGFHHGGSHGYHQRAPQWRPTPPALAALAGARGGEPPRVVLPPPPAAQAA